MDNVHFQGGGGGDGVDNLQCETIVSLKSYFAVVTDEEVLLF